MDTQLTEIITLLDKIDFTLNNLFGLSVAMFIIMVMKFLYHK